MLAQAPIRLPEGATAIGVLLDEWNPDGPAPIAETLVEVTRWLGGSTVFFGETSHLAPGVPFPSVAGTRSSSDPRTYRSPFEHACRPVLTAVATAGQPGADAGAGDAAREVLDATAPGCDGDCAARLAEALAQGDLLAGLPGRQRTAMRWLLAPGADPSMRMAALAGGSHPLDLDQQGSVLALFIEALQHDAAEAAGPRVSAAGLEFRPFTATDTATYFALSRPVPGPSWPGNLRRYRLAASSDPTAPAVPVGRDGEPVFDDSGRLRERSWSEWSAAADGPDPMQGGAAALLPRWDERRVFSNLADAPLTDAPNRVAPGNPLLTRERLGLPSADPRGSDLLVEWLLGGDVLDADLDGDDDERRHAVGDGGRRPPRILRYAPEGAALAFLATNDGVLHAFDADTGIERWAFMPAGLLSQAAERSSGGARFSRLHGLDGPVALMLEDANQDGRIDAREGDEAWLFLSLGRGGTGYYGLDVSDPDAPRLLWTLREGDLPGFAQSWPAPVPARMWLVPAVQGSDPRVLVLAGGHDPAEDAAVPPTTSLGAGLAVVAAASGTVLWRAAGPADPQADLELTDLRRSLPAAPRVLDSDGDGLHDRVYVLDAGGQLFRFDFPVNAVGDPAVTARRLADLGMPEGPDGPRRFQASPDVVLERRQGTDVLALSFGSGWASRPRSREAVDRFYVVFDAPHGGAAAEVIDESDLTDVTDDATGLPPAAAGWMYRLVAHGDGEKVTGSSLTFDHRLRFTTYQPLPAPAETPCGPPAGIARLYTLDIRDGRPVNHVGDRPVPDEELDVDGLAPALGIAFPPASQAACSHSGCRQAPTGLLGGRVVPLGFRNDPVRTSWRQLDADAE
jgi:type IV pilus assembly protein PilY1